MQQAYQAGFQHGQYLASSAAQNLSGAPVGDRFHVTECQTYAYDNAQLSAQYTDGCVAGYDAG